MLSTHELNWDMNDIWRWYFVWIILVGMRKISFNWNKAEMSDIFHMSHAITIRHWLNVCHFVTNRRLKQTPLFLNGVRIENLAQFSGLRLVKLPIRHEVVYGYPIPILCIDESDIFHSIFSWIWSRFWREKKMEIIFFCETFVHLVQWSKKHFV